MVSRALFAGLLSVGLLSSSLFAQSPEPADPPIDLGECQIALDDALGEIFELIEGLSLDLEEFSDGNSSVMVSSQVMMMGPDGQLVELEGDDALDFLADFDLGSFDFGDLNFGTIDCEVWSGADFDALPDFEELLEDFDFSGIEASLVDFMDDIADLDFDFENCLDIDFADFCTGGVASGVMVMGPGGQTMDWTGDLSDLPGFGEGGVFDALEGILDEIDFESLPFDPAAMSTGTFIDAQAFTLGPNGELVEIELDPNEGLQDWIDGLLEEIGECLPADEEGDE